VSDIICELLASGPEFVPELMIKHLIITPYLWLEKLAKNPEVLIQQLIQPYLRRRTPFEPRASYSPLDVVSKCSPDRLKSSRAKK
jgi:hypothetical protein